MIWTHKLEDITNWLCLTSIPNVSLRKVQKFLEQVPKRLSDQKIVVPKDWTKRLLDQKILGPKNCWTKRLLEQKIVGPKDCWTKRLDQKILWAKNSQTKLLSKDCWTKKFDQKIVGLMADAQYFFCLFCVSKIRNFCPALFGKLQIARRLFFSSGL